LDSLSADNIGVGASFALDASNAYVQSLADEIDDDGVIDIDELMADPEGQALAEALVAQLSQQLGVDASMVQIQEIVLPQTQTGRRLRESNDRADVVAVPPTLYREGYYTVPPMAELAKMPTARLTRLAGFRVGRVGFGEVRWIGAVDVSGLDLDRIVFIEHGDATVYSDHDWAVAKPATGSGLNKPAVVLLERILPASGVPGSMFEQELASSLKAAGATHLSYDEHVGRWIFAVTSF
jgi:hypothetical protein